MPLLVDKIAGLQFGHLLVIMNTVYIILPLIAGLGLGVKAASLTGLAYQSVASPNNL